MSDASGATRAIGRLLLGAALAAALLAGGARARATSSAPCPPWGAHLLGADSAVRVYSLVASSLPVLGGVEACLARGGARMTLVAAPSQRRPGLRSRLDLLALAGTAVAYVEGRFGVDAGCESVVVADVRARRVLRRQQVGCSVDAGLLRREVVTDVVVSRFGSAAWIVERGAPSQPKTLSVYAARGSGAAVLLDRSGAIGASSLRLASGTVSWSHAGLRRASSLQP
jgi:hypothetical protein